MTSIAHRKVRQLLQPAASCRADTDNKADHERQQATFHGPVFRSLYTLFLVSGRILSSQTAGPAFARSV